MSTKLSQLQLVDDTALTDLLVISRKNDQNSWTSNSITLETFLENVSGWVDSNYKYYSSQTLHLTGDPVETITHWIDFRTLPTYYGLPLINPDFVESINNLNTLVETLSSQIVALTERVIILENKG